MHRTASTLVAVGLLLAACQGSSDVGLDPPADGTGVEETGSEETGVAGTAAPADEPSPRRSAGTASVEGVESPSPSSQPAADIDVTATPDEVTPEWVTAVVNTLLAEYGEMTAEILAMPVQEDPTLPDGFEDRLDALFDGEYLERRRRELLLYLARADARSDLRPPTDFGALTFSADLVQVASADCIVAIGRLSQEATRTEGGALPWLSAISLAPNDDSRTVHWAILDELPNTSPIGAVNDDTTMRDSTLDDYGDALRNTCRSQG